MITPYDALNLILKNIHPLKVVSKPLSESHGYILAEEVSADRDMPPADRSAMDGFAVRSSDLTHCPCSLHLAGEVPAGSPALQTVLPGTCVRVLTGANIPPGADSVVMVEETEETGDIVTFRNPAKPGSNIRRQGEESKKGDILFSEGTVLGAAQIGLCAAVGKAELKVYSRPGVAVLCTGKELLDASESVQPHQIRDSNGPALCTALSTWGFTEITHNILPDNLEVITEELNRITALNDIVLLTGGVSVGEYDFVPEAVNRIGATIHFHKVAMKPGKPHLYATLPGNRHLFGLPGNPLSVLTGFYEFVLPALRRLSGMAEERCRTSVYLPLSNSVSSKKDRVRFILAKLHWNAKGPEAEPLISRGSADLTAGSKADGVIVVPENTGEIPSGAIAEFRPWRPLP